MTAGDHIYVNRFRYSHHGIDCGDGTVIHYGKKGIGRIERVSKTSFAGRKQIYVKEYGTCDPADVVVQRAESKLVEQACDLFGNNCEHFAYWCKTGKYKSEQVENAVATGAGGVAAVPMGMGTQVATQMATKAAKQALKPVSKILINVGVEQAPKVVGRAAASIVSALATDMVVETMLQDDEHLSQQEREARQTGRTVGQVASTVVAIGGGIAAAKWENKIKRVLTVVGGAAVAAAVAATAVLGITIALAVYLLMKGG